MKLLERRRNLIGAFARFIRFISGKPPLTLEACVNDKSTIDYKVYGESVQDGTPTPDAPVEVESVGEKSSNIAAKLKNIICVGCGYEWVGNGLKITTNVNTGGYGNHVKIPIIVPEDIEWGATYTFTCNAKMSLENMNPLLRVGYTRNSTNVWADFKNVGIKDDGLQCLTFTLPTEKPEEFGAIENNGYGTNYVMVLINIQRNALDEYGNITVTDIAVNKGGTPQQYEPCGYKIPVVATNGTDKITTNIYLDEPLRKIGDYADYIDFENQVVVRNIKRVDLKNANNTYSWIGRNGVTFSGILDKNYGRNNNALCNRNYYWTANGAETRTMWLGVESRTLFWIGILDYLGFTTKEELNEWLVNNPTYLLYGSDLPIETPIELPQLPTFKGTTIYSVDTNIQPSNMEVTYYSKERSVS